MAAAAFLVPGKGVYDAPMTCRSFRPAACCFKTQALAYAGGG